VQVLEDGAAVLAALGFAGMCWRQGMGPRTFSWPWGEGEEAPGWGAAFVVSPWNGSSWEFQPHESVSTPPPPLPWPGSSAQLGSSRDADRLLKAELVAGLGAIHQAVAPWE
jgi:hypothetical protein